MAIKSGSVAVTFNRVGSGGACYWRQSAAGGTKFCVIYLSLQGRGVNDVSCVHFKMILSVLVCGTDLFWEMNRPFDSIMKLKLWHV